MEALEQKDGDGFGEMGSRVARGSMLLDRRDDGEGTADFWHEESLVIESKAAGRRDYCVCGPI